MGKLSHSLGEKVEYYKIPKVRKPHEGVEVDYYFMASRFAGHPTEISMDLWTVIIDSEGFAYGLKTSHLGDFHTWKEVIRDRIKEHLYRVGVDNLQVKRLVRDIEIKKDGHRIPNNNCVGGPFIGIDGGRELYIRKDKFTFIK
ncbi:hypothetical protein NE848_12795 [Gramella jeungdoensis]|uniref:Uncharacterized protein n=1 Tax=Gramella jeungdoensis TaxID=708091 RepID=A0ABT0Z421_9FLAO|nr:hypothetical protein [Gramella jeungdoensis]MCM8570264.1 hypothetical protein [Gramella jeungdoensis]